MSTPATDSPPHAADLPPLPDADAWPALNDAQRAAVGASLDPQLVVAGPGTGKTRVLVCRAAYLLARYSEALRPSQLALITFTRKAARQLTARLASLVGPKAQHVRAGTIHQFCSRILDAHGARLDDVPDDFIVASDAVTDAFWQRWFDTHKPWCTRNDFHSFGQVKTRVSRAKLGLDRLPGRLQGALRAYRDMLQDRGALDFDDLLTKARDLVETHDDVRRAVRQDTRAILVDEFQDTDPVQYRVLWRVGKSGHPRDGAHLFCVADDDQSIYRFRGAEPRNLHKFIDRYDCSREDETLHVLRTNYRSNRAIYAVAEAVLSGDERLKRRGEIETTDASSTPVDLVACASEADEQAFVFDAVRGWIDDGVPRREIAVLAPWNATVQQLEDRFLRAGIACEASSTDPILQEPAAKQLLATLHLVKRVLQGRAFDGPLEDVLDAVLPEDMFARVRAFWERQVEAQDASFWGTFQRLARDRDAADEAGLRGHEGHLERVYAALGNILQHARTSDATVGSVADATLRQLSRSLELLDDKAGTLADPLDDDGVRAASSRLRAWRDRQEAGAARLLLYDRRDRRLRVWRTLLRRGLDLPDADVSDGDAPALFLEPTDGPPDPLGAEDLVATADLDGFARWAERYGALDADAPPHVLCLRQPSVPEETLRLAGIDPERVHAIAPEAAQRPTVRLFRLLQATVGPPAPEPLFPEYVMVDLETTSVDPERCRVAEIGAVRVAEGEEVDAFSTLVALPDDLTTDEADTLREVCGLDPDTDFDDAVPLGEAWSQLCDFVGTCPIVAHNGRQFDFRILRRLQKNQEADAAWAATYDTLPAAIELCPDLQRHTAEHLREHLLDETETTAHRALADCRDQVRLFDALQRRRAVRQRTSALEPLLPLVVAGVYDEAYAAPDEDPVPLGVTDRALLEVGYRWTLRDASPALDAVRRLLPRGLPELVRATPALYDAIDEDALLDRTTTRRPGLSGRIDALVAPFRDAPVCERLADVLRHLALWRTDDPRGGGDVVTLSTYHSAKGLEFARVLCTGVHDGAFPAFYDKTDADRRERRRVLYVGMTRAEQRLVLTHATTSPQGYDRERSPFLHAVPPELLRQRTA